MAIRRSPDRYVGSDRDGARARRGLAAGPNPATPGGEPRTFDAGNFIEQEWAYGPAIETLILIAERGRDSPPPKPA